ncbi:MAG: sigma-E processing peptidase SpoIIGA [Oscillospiraceae bacterium]|nr:sigma-E processing peptidase SpoIIGA [Oscillospiraceae bacterium]
MEFYHTPAPISTGFAFSPYYNPVMETVYLDELFLLNLVIDYFLLLATARICALPFRRGRFALSAALGGLWSCLSLLPSLAFLRSVLLQLALGMVMTLAAFGGERRLFRSFLAFLGVSALFGGALYAALLRRTGVPGSGPLPRPDMRALLLSFALCWALVSLVFRRSAGNAERRLLEVTLVRNGAAVRFPVLEDTGNDLYDGLTGRGILVAEADALVPLFPELNGPLLRGPPADLLPLLPGARLLPYAGISGERRTLVIFRPDRIAVEGADRDDLMVAIAPAPLDEGGRFRGIL